MKRSIMDAGQKVQGLVALLKEKGVTEVCGQYGLHVKYHKGFPSLAQFKYDQIKSDMGHYIPQVCRGIILDTKDDFKLVALPYTKFFNYGEVHADKIDWTTARVYEKLDGSIVTLYWYKDKWHVASSGLPDASGNTGGFRRLHGMADTSEADPIIGDEFWRIWKARNYKLPADLRKNFMFELILSKFRHIVHSAEDRIVLHGARNLDTLKELDPIQVAKEHGWECAQIVPATSLSEVIELSKKIKPSECEGFVIADANFQRVKVKSPQYVALSLLSSNQPEYTQYRFLEIIRVNEGSEFLTYFPHLYSLFNSIKSKFDRMCEEYDSQLTSLRARVPAGDAQEVQKLVAMTSSLVPWVFFQCKKTSAQSVREVLKDVDAKTLDDLMNKFEKPNLAKMKVETKKEKFTSEKPEE